MPTLAAARSFLFAPGSDERKLRKALASGADVVVVDLEDAVSVEQKDAAREVVRAACSPTTHPSGSSRSG